MWRWLVADRPSIKILIVFTFFNCLFIHKWSAFWTSVLPESKTQLFLKSCVLGSAKHKILSTFSFMRFLGFKKLKQTQTYWGVFSLFPLLCLLLDLFAAVRTGSKEEEMENRYIFFCLFFFFFFFFFCWIRQFFCSILIRNCRCFHILAEREW